MEYMIKAFGIKQVNTRFERMGVAAINAEPVMRSIGHMIMEIFDQIFESQGRRGGGSWKANTVSWLTYKQRHGLDQRVGHATLALRRSLSIPGATGQVFHVTPHTVDVGSELPYAATEQEHRPFVRFTDRDRLAMRQVVRDYLIAAWRTA